MLLPQIPARGITTRGHPFNRLQSVRRPVFTPSALFYSSTIVVSAAERRHGVSREAQMQSRLSVIHPRREQTFPQAELSARLPPTGTSFMAQRAGHTHHV